MKEQPINFGEGNGLSGIISLPDNLELAKKKPVLVVLNSGLLPRFGPNRLYVKIARSVANKGNIALRFDFAGVGESAPNLSEKSYEEQSLCEINQALNMLQKKYGVDKFWLTGICSGADISFQAARKDTRIAGIIPIDFYSLPSKSYLIHSYKRRMLSPKSWLNFLGGNSDLLGIFKSALNSLTLFKTAKASEETDQNTSVNVVDDLRVGFKTLFQRQLPIYLIYSAGSPAYFNYGKNFQNALQKLSPERFFKTDYLETADHGFTLLYHQQKLISKIQQWIDGENAKLN